MQRITVQVLNGATGEMREVIANVDCASEQDAVNSIFLRARRDDYYYRFLGFQGILNPVNINAVSVTHQNQTYWALEA